MRKTLRCLLYRSVVQFTLKENQEPVRTWIARTYNLLFWDRVSCTPPKTCWPWLADPPGPHFLRAAIFRNVVPIPSFLVCRRWSLHSRQTLSQLSYIPNPTNVTIVPELPLNLTPQAHGAGRKQCKGSLYQSSHHVLPACFRITDHTCLALCQDCGVVSELPEMQRYSIYTRRIFSPPPCALALAKYLIGSCNINRAGIHCSLVFLVEVIS